MSIKWIDPYNIQKPLWRASNMSTKWIDPSNIQKPLWRASKYVHQMNRPIQHHLHPVVLRHIDGWRGRVGKGNGRGRGALYHWELTLSHSLSFPKGMLFTIGNSLSPFLPFPRGCALPLGTHIFTQGVALYHWGLTSSYPSLPLPNYRYVYAINAPWKSNDT